MSEKYKQYFLISEMCSKIPEKCVWVDTTSGWAPTRERYFFVNKNSEIMYSPISGSEMCSEPVVSWYHVRTSRRSGGPPRAVQHAQKWIVFFGARTYISLLCCKHLTDFSELCYDVTPEEVVITSYFWYSSK